ncbi:MAG: YkgJ family cysteine cluster protein [Lachnospiraceae bacterium]|nr:YkgJ family cysteine cluster protein [Lachnospiraceae bacterium]
MEDIMKLYGINDMARADCGGCAGCSACCRGMGDTIVLDPLDIWRLTKRLGRPFEALLEDCIGLHVEEGMILPHLLMTGENRHCIFLNEEGRCSIHEARPGLCRIFPLGRSYEAGDLRYFLLDECPKDSKMKVKIRKWLDTPEPEKNQRFLTVWHDFRKKLQEKTAVKPESSKEINLFMLKLFFVQPYDTETDFYSQFETRHAEACAWLKAASFGE